MLSQASHRGCNGAKEDIWKKKKKKRTQEKASEICAYATGELLINIIGNKYIHI